MAMKPRLDRDAVAMRVAKDLPDGTVVNLGIGIPTLVSQYIPEGRSVLYHSESGVLGYGPLAEPGEEDLDLINAGGQFLKRVPGMAFFDSATAFAMIRGGHIDVAVLGALQVSEEGDLANWMLPQRGIGNVGGAMDLAAGARRIIAAMEHTDKEGNPKVLARCAYPLTGRACVNLIVTDLAVLEILGVPERDRFGRPLTKPKGQGLLLRELAPGWTVEEIQALTGARLQVAEDVKEIEL